MNKKSIIQFLDLIGAKKIRDVGSAVMCSCPFASILHDKGSDRHISFGIFVENSRLSNYNCFACGSKGTLSGLLYKLKSYGLLDNDKIKELFTFVNKAEFDCIKAGNPSDGLIAYNDIYDIEITTTEKLQNDVFNNSNFSDIPIDTDLYDYIIRKVKDVNAINKFNIKYDYKNKKIVLPIYDFSGDLVGCSCRVYPPNAIVNGYKYLYYKYDINNNKFVISNKEGLIGFDKNKYLYGEWLVDINKDIYVVEGQFDCIAMHSYGYNTVATFGVNVSDKQIVKILSYLWRGHKIYILFDNDKAGKLGAENLKHKLIGKGINKNKIVIVTINKDPDEYTKEDLDYEICKHK